MNTFVTSKVALRALSRNKLRSSLTALGLIIGVGAVVTLVGIGNGAKAQIEARVASLGQNVLQIKAGSVTKSAVRQGTETAVSLSMEDAEAIRREIPDVVAVSPEIRTKLQAVSAFRNWKAEVYGESPEYFGIRQWPLSAGDYFTDQDMRIGTTVAVLGSVAAQEFFGEENAVGETFRLQNIPFQVIGVLESKGETAAGDDQDDTIIVPITTAMQRLIGKKKVHVGLRRINIQASCPELAFHTGGITAHCEKSAPPRLSGLDLVRRMKKSLRILLLEDSATDAELVHHTLRRGGLNLSMECVDNRNDFIRQLRESPPDVILADFSLPGFDGYAALALAQEVCPGTPFIFVTGTMGEEVAIESLKKGATDYVLKHRLGRLVPSVSRALREARERAERRLAEKRLRDSHEQLRSLSVHLRKMREEERTRIAREVHDELGQALTGLKLQLTWLAGRLPRELKALEAQAQAMAERIDETIQNVRRIATELRPGLLDTAGLQAALEWQANEFQNQTGIRCRVKASLEETLSDQDLNTAFFRIFQEALTNIIRHARAS